MPEVKDITCPACGALFGRETRDETGPVLTIKLRDIHRTMRGDAWGPCRLCGVVVRWHGKRLTHQQIVSH